MVTFVLVHGGGADAGYWYRVAPMLEERGHAVVVPQLPTTDEAATFETYADTVVAAVEGRSDLVVVGQSMGAFTAAVVADRLDPALLVLLAPMIPVPGETPSAWGDHVGLRAAQERAAEAGGYDPAFDLVRTFMHDVAPDVVDEVMSRGEPPQAPGIFDCPFPLRRWPAVSTRVVAGDADRFFPLDLVTRLSRERLGVEPDLVSSGHLPAFSAPEQVVDRLLAYAERLTR